jgi:hypothetical protein
MLSGRVGGGDHVGWRRLPCVIFGMSPDEVLIARRPTPERRLRHMPGTGGRRAGLEDVTPHDLSPTHGSWVARKHGIMAAAKRLGTPRPRSRPHYAREVDGRDAEIAASFEPGPATLGAHGGAQTGRPRSRQWPR